MQLSSSYGQDKWSVLYGDCKVTALLVPSDQDREKFMGMERVLIFRIHDICINLFTKIVTFAPSHPE